MILRADNEILPEEIQEINTAIEKLTAVGEAGGGFVKITINGHFCVLKIDYEDCPNITDDLKTYNDLIVIAFNVAMDKIKDKVANFISRSHK